MKYLFLFFIIIFNACENSKIFDGYAFDGSSKQNLNLKNIKGNKILFFGFLSCPDICPTALSFLQEVLKNRNDIKLIYVSLDEKRDEIENIYLTASYFHKNSIAFKPNNLKKFTNFFKAKYKIIKLPNSSLKYTIAHSSSFYLLDENSNLINEISNLDTDEIKSAIKEFF